MSSTQPWLSNYPTGVPAKVDPDQYTNLSELLDECFRKYRKQTAFYSMGKGLTYGEVDNLSMAFASYLRYRGLKPGDKLAIMMPNLLQYPIALFGAVRAGVVVVNTNPLYTPREMKHQFNDSGAKAVLICENFASNLEEIIDDTPIEFVMITSIGEMLPFFKRTMVNFAVRTIKKMVPKYNLSSTIPFSTCLAEGRKHKIQPHDSKPDDILALQYTGGTTGVSKGAMLTHKNMVSNTLQSRAWVTQGIDESSGTVMCPLPLYHIFAFTVNCLTFFSHGMSNVLIVNPRDIGSLVKAFKSYDMVGMTGVNTLYNALNNNSEFQQLDFSALKAVVGGGMAVQRPVAEAWQRITGIPLSEGYGMTESSPCASMNPINNDGQIGTIGMPLPSTDMRIWIEEESRVGAAGEVGEIQIKGPQVMKGYYNRPDETAKTIKDGWLCSGDIGMMQEDGFFKIVDRKKDMILVSGFNVYPNEVEEVIASHPKVMEVAAVGIPHEKSGEVVKVFVVKKDKSLNEKEVEEFARENLTGYKVPKAIEFRDELPKTNVGKILRRALREA
ncbi:MAG: AMP-binding protein [Bacteroidota bacterium]